MNYLKIAIIYLLLLSLNSHCNGQIIYKSGEIYTEVAAIISGMPGSTGDNYVDPNTMQLNTWENTLNNLLLGNTSLASDSANSIGYQLVHFTDTSFVPNRQYYVLETIDSNYWGTYVYYPNYCRPVVIQSPHAKKDANTGHQGIHVFKETEALFYYVTGTHRCNSNSFSNCSGTTTGCSGSSEPYRLSDLAHTTTSIFQKTTEVLLNTFSNTHFIQLHGFAKQSTDPYVILSNGTQVTPAIDHLSTFKNKLFEADSTLTFKVAHIDLSWTRLRGFFNTQGRLINGSSDACNNNATTSQGRFFHIEQEKTKLRDNAIGWNKIAYAINHTFSCTMTAISTVPSKSQEDLTLYPNPATQSITVEWPSETIERKEVAVYNQLGEEVSWLTSLSQVNEHKIVIYLSNLSRGLYIVKIKETAVKFYKE